MNKFLEHGMRKSASLDKQAFVGDLLGAIGKGIRGGFRKSRGLRRAMLKNTEKALLNSSNEGLALAGEAIKRGARARWNNTKQLMRGLKSSFGSEFADFAAKHPTAAKNIKDWGLPTSAAITGLGVGSSILPENTDEDIRDRNAEAIEQLRNMRFGGYGRGSRLNPEMIRAGLIR